MDATAALTVQRRRELVDPVRKDRKHGMDFFPSWSEISPGAIVLHGLLFVGICLVLGRLVRLAPSGEARQAYAVASVGAGVVVAFVLFVSLHVLPWSRILGAGAVGTFRAVPESEARTWPLTKERLVGPDPLSAEKRQVLQTFLGSSPADLLTRLPEESSSVREGFMWMDPSGLARYLPVVLDYLESDAAAGDWEMSHGLLCSLAYQSERADDMLNTADFDIWRIAQYIDGNREKFGIEADDELMESYLRRIEEACSRRVRLSPREAGPTVEGPDG